MRICPECKKPLGPDEKTCPRDGSSPIEVPDERDLTIGGSYEFQCLDSLKAPNARYTIISKIGQGGWGGVYRAYQHSTNREVALKVLRREVAGDNQVRRRFHQEAKAVSQLKHPNTVTVFDFGETSDGLLFIAMELVEGASLAYILSHEGPLPPQRAVRIARQIALSLAEAHSKGIIHRDIKPHNIMIANSVSGNKDFVKVLDFGVAKVVGVDTSLTTTGHTFGTPEYMSPEQVQSKDVDYRSDLYSLGIVLYEMLSGQTPFSGETAVSVAMAQVHDKPPPLHLPGEQCRPLVSLVNRLLSKDPKQRGESAAKVAEELEAIEIAFATGRPMVGDAPMVLRRVASSVASRWSSLVMLLAGVCVLLVAFIAGKNLVLPDAGDKKGEQSQAMSLPPSLPSPEPRGRQTVSSTQLSSAELSSLAGHPDLSDIALPKSEIASEGETPKLSASAPSAVTAELRNLNKEEKPSTPTSASSISQTVRLIPTPESENELLPLGHATEQTPHVTSVPIDPTSSQPSDVASTLPGGTSPTRKVDKAKFPVVLVHTIPPGAEIVSDGKILCTTPCSLSGKKGTTRKIFARLKDHYSAEATIHFGKDKITKLVLAPLPLSIRDGLKGPATLSELDGLK